MTRNNDNFKIFMSGIDNDMRLIFENQKEYIRCKKGCSLCCEEGDYPVSQAEFDYMTEGFELLDMPVREEIKEKARKIKLENRELYTCPFLIDKNCSIYEYRPFVCRLFGVLTTDAAENPAYPFCMKEKLNYYNIYDEEKGCMSMDLVLEKKYKNVPRFFNLSNAAVMKLPLAKELNIDFGKTDRLINFM